jgi:sigma-54-specific transcriptional regulator
VLQEREVVRLGSRQPIPIDVRLVAATNVDLFQAVRAGRFREDLYYRLKVAVLDLPPLRERPGDILPLAGYFLDQYRQRLGSGPVEFQPVAARRLLEHPWPGNIRELENVIHSALVVSSGPEILAADLHLTPSVPSPPATTTAAPPPTADADGLGALEQALLALYDRNLPDLHGQLEAAIMRTAFTYCHRNQLQTARLLGISRNIVRARLLQLGEIAGGSRGGELPPHA